MGNSRCKGFKLNGNLITTNLEGIKVNGAIPDGPCGFWVDGNWVEPGPFICTLGSISSNASSTATTATFTFKTGVSSTIIYVDDVATTITSDSKAVRLVDCTLKVYDGIATIDFRYTYTTTNSKGNSTSHTATNLKSIIQWGGYMTQVPSCYSISTGSGYCKDLNLPCNYTSFTSMDLSHDDTYLSWAAEVSLFSIAGTDSTKPWATERANYLTDRWCIPAGIATELLYNASGDELPTSVWFQTPGNSDLATLGVRAIECYNSTLYDQSATFSGTTTIPKSVTKISTTAGGSNGNLYGVYPYTPNRITLQVYWDRNGNICGDASKPVENYARLIPDEGANDTFVTGEHTYYCPIVKYWGEWTPDPSKGE